MIFFILFMYCKQEMFYQFFFCLIITEPCIFYSRNKKKIKLSDNLSSFYLLFSTLLNFNKYFSVTTIIFTLHSYLVFNFGKELVNILIITITLGFLFIVLILIKIRIVDLLLTPFLFLNIF